MPGVTLWTVVLITCVHSTAASVVLVTVDDSYTTPYAARVQGQIVSSGYTAVLAETRRPRGVA